ncbi:hypothetical protein ABH20_05990 [Geobacillus sp. T6]|nr:hypothetical protein ABH20_05990 [Geobacillus sp. T6]
MDDLPQIVGQLIVKIDYRRIFSCEEIRRKGKALETAWRKAKGATAKDAMPASCRTYLQSIIDEGRRKA